VACPADPSVLVLFVFGGREKEKEENGRKLGGQLFASRLSTRPDQEHPPSTLFYLYRSVDAREGKKKRERKSNA